MPSSILLIWIGALLVVVGVLITAGQALWRGRLSDARRFTPGVASDSLEPQGTYTSFSLRANWPGLALMVVGAILLLIGGSL